MMSVSINMVLNAEHRYDLRRIRIGLIKQIRMVGFSGILGTGQGKDQKMMKGNQINGKEL